MDKLRVRTKFEVLFTILIVVMLMAISVASYTRIISDNEDNILTAIRNTNGKYWIASGSNIQTAIDDLGDDGGAVFLPAGEFYVSSTVDLSDNVALIGSGIGSTIIRTTTGGSWHDGILAIDDDNENPLNIGDKNCYIADLTVIGDESINSVHGISISDGSYNCSVLNVRILNPTSCGLVISRSENIHIDNVEVNGIDTSPNHAINIRESNQITLDNIVVKNVTSGDVALDWSYARNVTANNILVYDVDYGIKIDADESSPPNPSRDCQFNNLIMHGRDGNGIGFQQGANHIQFSNVELYGFNKGIDVDVNSDYIYFNNVYINGGGGECDFDGDHIFINNLILEEASANSIHLDGSHICVSNSQFIGNSGGQGAKITGDHIVISNCQVINDNGLYAGFYIDGASDVTLDSCIVTGSTRGVYVTDGSTHWKITDCSFRNNDKDGIYIASGSNTDYYIISNCDLTGNSGTNLNDQTNGAHSVKSNNLT